ncbi:type I phosphomannose isomerase catalytic subunit [Polaribacter aquimarinus]|uniref:Phosphohexomutase n=1 Tax=Polaribacter aquimarinus TaxID=2100726 RepID=A0A2U2J9V4_9FLAO|nr:type I phosphomannose isomerase catalytic subunit [Polaribacter aquimarinus]PWG05123.1 mannose-6-phosphate isomerase [Polaribacter aquimarinus]
MNQLLKFKPILKEKVWGGEKLKNYLNKESELKNIGESWEISDVKENASVVSNGTLKGKDLKELILEHKSSLVGAKVYSKFRDKFPVLIKFVDAKKPLSVQVHPNDKLALKRHNSLGKTEMWYVMQADKEASIIVGFQKEVNSKTYLHHLKNKSLTDILNIDKVKKGDVYFIPTGTVHAIGAGVLFAEIQQTSDITYRIYDWDRPNSDGTYRELHTEEALEAIDYSAKESYKTNYTKQQNSSSEIVSCPYFTTNVLPLMGKIALNHSDKDSFVIYICVDGDVEFKYQNQVEKLKKGETILVPASIKELEIFSEKHSELLEVYIK